jgi:hypothetical protein
LTTNKILKHSRKPGRKNLERIAQAIVTKYPESLKDALGEIQVGSGYDSLARQLEHRIDNVTRGERPSSKRRLVTADGDNASEERDSYGCVLYLPADMPEGETAALK